MSVYQPQSYGARVQNYLKESNLKDEVSTMEDSDIQKKLSEFQLDTADLTPQQKRNLVLNHMLLAQVDSLSDPNQALQSALKKKDDTQIASLLPSPGPCSPPPPKPTPSPG